ncbi:LysR family transcriptional regulator [Burkholderia sp. SCN-KJ]|uniref:LysR family transcriptional regulator n=1 Tax=Burkholderia sp. SCN-KJ TaxID=2969248 RepID=UPI002150411D|nr:LysR family transcriptional regulator [Burkholderia sp. SCN-KJ]MCR4466217.1 LysR family transcriptional regulator [Burkholderia sp. SCN-KJ]
MTSVLPLTLYAGSQKTANHSFNSDGNPVLLPEAPIRNNVLTTMLMNRIDAMALFVTAIDAGSLSAAARERGLSLSSVSRYLTMLEERIGTRLIIRSTRMLALTEAGRAYYEKAKRLLAEIDEMEASLTEASEAPVGKLHVCGPTLFGRVFMLPILAKFLVDNPKVTLDVMLLDRQLNLVEEGIDIAVRIGHMEDSSLIARRLGSLRWVISAAPDYLDKRGTPQSIEDLDKHDCLIYGQSSISSEWQMLSGGKPTNVKVPVRMRSNTLDGVVAAAVEGAGLVYSPAWSVAQHVAEGRLQVLLRNFELPPRPINAVFTHNRLMAVKVRSLLDYFVEHLSKTDFDTVPEFRSAL